eukprot:jgi/Ulvmu1/6811/UM031_0014.1
MLDCADMFSDMLADGVRVMIYAGDQDLICNWLGNRRWVDALKWDGVGDWTAAKDCAWEVEGSRAGSTKQAGPLSFVVVHNAGHLVPMDQGKNSLDMIQHFTDNKAFECAGPAAEASGTASAFLHHRGIALVDSVRTASSR